MDTIIARRGDLSTAWLAANYDKKLSKQQLLHTNVSKLTDIISEDIKHELGIPLRYSGTLLLGVTKIYSRQTKYVQDVANDIELKSRYRVNLKISNVNLKSNDTIINLSKNNILKDQITKFDLLYQPELNFDDITRMFSGNNRASVDNDDDNIINDTTDFDTSIEIGRGLEHEEIPEPHTPVEIDLFGEDDENFDQSIEVGRNNGSDIPLDHQSDFEIDLGQPLETIDEIDQQPQIVVPKVKRTGITEDGELITNKRRLKVDDVLDIPIATLREYQTNLLTKSDTFQLSNSKKLQIIYSEGINNLFKKRKLDLTLPYQIPSPQPEIDDNHDLIDQTMDFIHDYDVDFDLSLPEIQPQTPIEEDFLTSSQDNVQSTKQIADQLKVIYNDTVVTDLSTLIESDLNITNTDPEKAPLGSTQSNKINHRKEAAKCFFELLVLATNDCIELNQSVETTQIGGKINIRGRDKLYAF